MLFSEVVAMVFLFGVVLIILLKPHTFIFSSFPCHLSPKKFIFYMDHFIVWIDTSIRTSTTREDS